MGLSQDLLTQCLGMGPSSWKSRAWRGKVQQECCHRSLPNHLAPGKVYSEQNKSFQLLLSGCCERMVYGLRRVGLKGGGNA